jgi:hypothetical protein
MTIDTKHFPKPIVVDRHRFDPDPDLDPNFHFDADPDHDPSFYCILMAIRSGSGDIKIMPIHMRILPQGLHMFENKETFFFTFIYSDASLQQFSLLIKGKCVMIFGIFDSCS